MSTFIKMKKKKTVKMNQKPLTNQNREFNQDLAVV